MTRKSVIRSCILLSYLWVATAVAQIYTYTDEDGIVHFTNVKPPSGQSFKSIRVPCYASDPKCSQLDWENVPLNRNAFRDEIALAAQQFGVEESLIRAIIHAESAYQPDARSPKGAQGLMQLMPATQVELEVADPYHPGSNILGGTRYLSDMLVQFKGDLDKASAAYNAGPGAVRKYGGIPPYSETREYVRRIRILYRRYSADKA